MKKILLPLLVFTIGFTSCKKENEEADKVGGCTDTDSPFYQTGLDFDDGNCKYAYVTEVILESFPELDNGSSWDFPGGKADVYVEIKPVSSPDYANFFTSKGNEIDNVLHNIAQNWTSANQFKLTNTDWYYQVFDHDVTSSDDLIASGTFNPIESINTSDNTCTFSAPNGTTITLNLLIN